ncbi:DUF2190 family protein [Hyphomicrobium sp. CS1GBMeth3]|uniref:DUF2190 family protein n=1 Tax=Hyphomicrobium sp. CS1GBMeth3 TaxID=1892845 RepID=UPI000930D3F8|nr:DUF2190 family protein [Hyphomicrobium sp. CS1GBMeth3]
MGNVQPNYNAAPDIGYEGQIADMRSYEAVSRICEDATLAFGRAVIRGTADNQVKVGAAGKFVGITMRDITLPAANNDAYKQGNTVAVMTRGTMFAIPGANVADGDAVYYTATGALTNVATDNTLIPNAVWERTTSSGNLGLIRLQ